MFIYIPDEPWNSASYVRQLCDRLRALWASTNVGDLTYKSWDTRNRTLGIQRWVSGLGKMGLIRKYQYCLSEKLGQEQFGNLLSSSTDHLQTKMIVTTEA
jgi:hypothetical protein